jgi:hypothetical protein
MPDSSFSLQGALYVWCIVRKIEGRFRLAFAHWGLVLPPEHARERGEYQDYFSSLSLAPLQFPVRSGIRTLSRATSKPDCKGSSVARMSSSATRRLHCRSHAAVCGSC